MEKRIYEEKPLEIEEVVSVGVRTTIMRFGIAETESGWECEESCFNHKDPLTEADYSRLVAFLVRERFSADDVEAITQNYLSRQTEKHLNEWLSLQEWREESKLRAKEVLGMV